MFEEGQDLAATDAAAPTTPAPTTIESLARTVSFVVPALNEEKHVGRCVDSISALRLPDTVRGVEVIVVDNHSTDNTAEVCRSRGARVVSAPPGKPSRARNIGARCAAGEWIAFIDADCEAAPDWLARCAAHLENPDVLAVGGRVVAPPTLEGWVARAASDLASDVDARVSRVKWLPTAGLLVRRDAFLDVGGFDETLTTCEDCELGYRLSGAGTLVRDGRAAVVHHGESNSLAEIFLREAWRSRDNLRLAVARPLDWRNWASLLIPLSFSSLALLGVITLPFVIARSALMTPWLTLLLLLVVAPPALILIKHRRFPGTLSLARQAAVLSTYFLGRAAGLCWGFRRLER